MRKDLHQPLERCLTHVELLIEDQASGKFFKYLAEGDYLPECWPTFEIDEGTEQLALRVIQAMQPIGFVPSWFQEITRLTRLSYSFVDATPGNYGDEVYVHVMAEAIPAVWSQEDAQKPGELVDLQEMQMLVKPARKYENNAPYQAVRRLIREVRES
jgi:hypothetical protein